MADGTGVLAKDSNDIASLRNLSTDLNDTIDRLKALNATDPAVASALSRIVNRFEALRADASAADVLSAVSADTTSLAADNANLGTSCGVGSPADLTPLPFPSLSLNPLRQLVPITPTPH